MQRILLIIVSTFVFGLAPAVPAAPANADESAIRAVLDAQVKAWNNGDVVTFMQGYKNSDETTFVGHTVRHGYSAILERYRKDFAGKEQMGTLSFDSLEVHPLDAHYAVVTGQFHLVRNAAGGGNANGIFSLIFERTSAGWKIILDHTS